jgi:hypothetical protein
VLTAARIITEAAQIAKVPGFVTQQLELLNAVLSDLCQSTDLALARGQYNFNFNPSLTSTLFGSGPYSLPLDYLRTSGSSGARGVTKSAFYLYPAPAFPAGQPIFMTPIDLAEFDLFAKLPSQSTPELWCTDMGAPLTQRIVLATTMQITINSTAAIAQDPAAVLTADLSVAGEGIAPGTTIISATPAAGATTLVLSAPSTATITSASVFFGIAPVAYVYPAPLSNWPVTVRYQRWMPPLVDTSQYPWFPNDGYLIDKLAARLMALADDTRELSRDAKADKELGKYLGLSDDKTNRSQAVQLDGRNYGTSALGGRNLRNTKTMGW